jgi:hypothetical protein
MGKSTASQAAQVTSETKLTAVKVVDAANKLSGMREQFEKQELARSNKALYEILTNVYELFYIAVEAGCIKESVYEMRKQLKLRGIKVQVNSPALTVFVRYIFNSDRKRAYNYASTLMAAAQAEVKPEHLTTFIEGKNGVEECKKEYKMKEETKLRKDAIKTASVEVLDAINNMPAAERISLPNTSVDLSDGTQFAFILARSVGNGEFDLLKVIPKTSKAMQSAAVKELAKDFIDCAEKAAKASLDASVKDATERAVKTMTAKEAANMTIAELELA